MNKNLILPISGDMNRGDQALVWETVATAKNANFSGDFYILSEGIENYRQSKREGIKVAEPILKHPSRKFKEKDNNTYDVTLLLKWGIVSIIDFLYSLLFLSSFTRIFMKKIVSDETNETLKLFEDSNAFFVKGGGFIHASGKISDPYTIYYSLYHIFLAHSLNKPVYVMPNSFGPFKGIGVEWMVKRALEKCQVVTVRESISKKMLEEIGVSNKLVPDLGFNLDKSTENILTINQLKEKHPDKKYVAITARPYRFPKNSNPEEKYREYIESVVDFSSWLYSKGYMPVFVEQVLSQTTHESDLTAITEITDKLVDGQYEIISDNTFDCRDIKEIYSEMDYTIGTRFHSVIFSLSERVPSIAIEYGGNKGEGILKDIGLSQYGIPIEEVSFEVLKNKFNILIENRTEVYSIIDKYIEHVKIRQKEFEQFLSNKKL